MRYLDRRIGVGLLAVFFWLGGETTGWAQEELFVANAAPDSVTVYARTANGDVAPLRTLSGPGTGLSGLNALFVDTVHDELFVVNLFSNSITVYPRTASGNAIPIRTLQGPATGLGAPASVVVDLVHDALIVADSSPAVRVFSRTANGDQAPLRTLTGEAALMSNPVAVVDLIHDELVVLNESAAPPSVTVYPRTASGNVPPTRMLQGPATGFNVGANLAIDLVHDELVVADFFGSIRVFARTASGNTAPLRTIEGVTQLGSPLSVTLDLVHDELVVAGGGVRVYPRTGSGNVAPLRVIVNDGNQGRFAEVATSPPLFAAVLPSSRSVQVGTAATAFSTIINAGPGPAQSCALTPITAVPGTFHFQATNLQNQLTGTPDTPVNIPAGAAQQFVFAFMPTAPFGPIEALIGFACQQTNRAPVIIGLNTLLVSASATAVPDVIAVAATVLNNGIVDVPGPTGIGFFAVASANVGATGTIMVGADTGGVSLPLLLTLCETNTATGACLAPPAQTLTVAYAGGSNRSFAIFAQGTGIPIPFDPASNRVFVRFGDLGQVTRGSTSVAVRTQ